MTQHAYIAEMVSLPELGWVPCVAEYEHLWRAGVSHGETIGLYSDGRDDIEGAGYGLAECDVPDDVHEVLIADARIETLV